MSFLLFCRKGPATVDAVPSKKTRGPTEDQNSIVGGSYVPQSDTYASPELAVASVGDRASLNPSRVAGARKRVPTGASTMTTTSKSLFTWE